MVYEIDQDLLRKAKESANLPSEDLVKLALQMGWQERETEGGHRVFRHPGAWIIKDKFPRPLNLQPGRDGKAKVYQVKQLLAMAQEIGIIK